MLTRAIAPDELIEARLEHRPLPPCETIDQCLTAVEADHLKAMPRDRRGRQQDPGESCRKSDRRLHRLPRTASALSRVSTR